MKNLIYLFVSLVVLLLASAYLLTAHGSPAGLLPLHQQTTDQAADLAESQREQVNRAPLDRAPTQNAAIHQAAVQSAVQHSSTGEAREAQDAPIPQTLAFPGREFLYLSTDYGKSWDRLNPKRDIPDSTYITAAAVNPQNSDHIIIGTSFYGLYESTDAGASWQDMDPNVQLRALYQGAGFYDEIAGILFSESAESLYIRSGFHDNIFLLDLGNKSIEALDPANSVNEVIYNTDIAEDAQTLYHSLLENEGWPQSYPIPQDFSADNNLPQTFVRDSAWSERRAKAENRVGIYINSYQISEYTDEFIQYLSENNFNSVVLDFKDDNGILRYNSRLAVAEQIDSVRARYNAEELIARLHAEGIYVIARVVVFKDRALYRYNNNEYALWDKRLNEAWGVYRGGEQVEYWVDPYSNFVRDYNIQIARELEALGVDEIQFDYIRFPSDGRTQDIESRYISETEGFADSAFGTQNSERVRILAAFLSEARNALSIPLGTDVFGFNGWSRMSFLGQDIEVMSHFVDVISPMSYPSHYPRNFFAELSYLERAQLIYEEGSRRAREITNDRVLIRQYVQAFLLGGELDFSEEVYHDYLHRQLDGTLQGGGSGFTLWNNSGRYYMVNNTTIENFVRPVAQKRPVQ